MLGLVVVVIMGLAIVGTGLVAGRLHLPSPVLLLAVGALLGFAPALRQVHLPPELMLLVFLPVLLYWESLTVTLRDLRTNFSAVILASTLLVVVTAATVAVVTHALGLPWGAALILGAALAPTDATAVGALAQLLPGVTAACSARRAWSTTGRPWSSTDWPWGPPQGNRRCRPAM